jgi:hypothetical protein
MVGSVIERGETQIIGGLIHHDDRPLSWAEGDARAGRRLDRRKSWAFIEGRLCETVSWSCACSGCYGGYDGHSARGMGCAECGYQGRVRNRLWVPPGEAGE